MGPTLSAVQRETKAWGSPQSAGLRIVQPEEKLSTKVIPDAKAHTLLPIFPIRTRLIVLSIPAIIAPTMRGMRQSSRTLELTTASYLRATQRPFAQISRNSYTSLSAFF